MTERRVVFKPKLLCVVPLVAIMMMSSAAFAANTSSTTVTVKVTVVSEPCIINGGNAIDVDFGDGLLTTKVDGLNYMTPIVYTLDCSGVTVPALKMQISGTAAGFDNNVLQVTEQANMGIKLLNNSTELPLNSWLNFTKDSPPVLQAVPVKASGSALIAGAFSSAATMTVDYQ